jgi:ATP-binding cassette subfamily B multidrug efflux pump
MNLRRILQSHLWPYRRLLLVVVVLQAVQTFATLTLPALSANLINHGVLEGDNAYIWRVGAIMLAFSLVQIVFAITAVRFGARVSMAFGRDVRRDLFHKVTDFSTREVGRFGAPSLITRITNDVQQIQMVVVMFTTMMIAAPITMVIGVILALREDIGLSVVLLVSIPVSVIVLGIVIVRMVPAYQVMQSRIDRLRAP